MPIHQHRGMEQLLASYAPNGGGQWQTVGMRAVPVALLTELKESLTRAAP